MVVYKYLLVFLFASLIFPLVSATPFAYDYLSHPSAGNITNYNNYSNTYTNVSNYVTYNYTNYTTINQTIYNYTNISNTYTNITQINNITTNATVNSTQFSNNNPLTINTNWLDSFTQGISGWYHNLTSHITYTIDSMDKICIGSACLNNPFYKVTIEGGLNVTGTVVLDKVAKANAVTGNLEVYNNVTAYYYNGTGASWTDDVWNATKEPTGFSEQGTFSSILNFDNSNRNFSICPNSTIGNYVTYYKGKKIVHTHCDSLIIPNTAGYTNFIYFDASDGNTLTQSTSPWGNDFFNTIQVATVFWNGTVGLIGKERHGITMDSATHYYLHTTVGTRYVSGFTGIFTTPANWSLTAGTIADEDNIDTNPLQNQTHVWFHQGNGRYTFTPTQTNFTFRINNILQYDNLTGTSNVGTAQYVAYWIVESVDRDTPTYTIMGQRQDNTLANAQTNNKWESMSLGALDIPEYKLLYRIILKRQGTATSTIEDVQDLRSVSNLPSGTYVASSHGALTGLTNDDHLQYVLVDGTRNVTNTNYYLNSNPSGFYNYTTLPITNLSNYYNKTEVDNNVSKCYLKTNPSNYFNSTDYLSYNITYATWAYNQTLPALNFKNWLNYNASTLIITEVNTTNCTGGSSSPISHYKMNDNSASTSVVENINSYDGTANFNTEDRTTTGIINGALYLNGGDYIELPSTSVPRNNTPRMMMAWVKMPSSYAGNGYFGLVIYGQGSYSKQWGFYIRSDNYGPLTLECYGNDVYQMNSGTNIYDDAWHHVAATFDGDTTIALWIDGSKVAENTAVTINTSNTDTNPIKVGYTGGFTGDGTIDDLRIYDFYNETTLTNIYNSGVGTEDDSSTPLNCTNYTYNVTTTTNATLDFNDTVIYAKDFIVKSQLYTGDALNDLDKLTPTGKSRISGDFEDINYEGTNLKGKVGIGFILKALMELVDKNEYLSGLIDNLGLSIASLNQTLNSTTFNLNKAMANLNVSLNTLNTRVTTLETNTASINDRLSQREKELEAFKKCFSQTDDFKVYKECVAKEGVELGAVGG